MYKSTGFREGSPFRSLERIWTGDRRKDDFHKPQNIVQGKLAELPTASLDGINFEFELIVRLGARFWANQATLPQATETAERALVCLLYKDVIGDLSGITRAIMDGDRQEALERIVALRTALIRGERNHESE